MRLTKDQIIEMEMIAAAERDAEAKANLGDIDTIRPADRVVDVTDGDDWEDFESWFDAHVVPEWEHDVNVP